jgi:hypothetical protein
VNAQAEEQKAQGDMLKEILARLPKDVTLIFLAFIGVCFYALRGYVKYVAIHSEMECDKEYLTEISRASAVLQKQLNKFGGLDKGLGNNPGEMVISKGFSFSRIFVLVSNFRLP